MWPRRNPREKTAKRGQGLERDHCGSVKLGVNKGHSLNNEGMIMEKAIFKLSVEGVNEYELMNTLSGVN